MLELLTYIDPAGLDYQQWVNVGMALKEEGYSADDWDRWSMADKRYKRGECAKKWASFRGAVTPVTAGTIVTMARQNGWKPAYIGGAIGWEGEIGWDGQKVDTPMIDVVEPDDAHWKPVDELIQYLETLFAPSDLVGYVTETWEKDGDYKPKKGSYDRTASQLIQELKKCNGDIGAVIGDYKPEAGAWIRFNPLDGKGVTNDNVTDYRYALVESDKEDIGKQNAILRRLELPIAALVHSGKKSLHAIVHLDAKDANEYRQRVNYLYAVCQKKGLEIDTQNRNPSRLSRMPGIRRNGHKQFLVAVHIGKQSWAEWEEWMEEVDDDLPDTENLAAQWDHLPELAAPLIDGILRQGHKLLIAGPSKAGKSFALIEMCIAIAEGRKWLSWQCNQGKVLYVNLELDRASCLHRFADVYGALGWKPKNIANIDVWNLRGKSIPMDKLAPKLIRRALKKEYIAVILDPIYKVITGDENSANQMADFCNQFDKVCTELGCAVIYCHHHSKGLQSGKKSMDRASGSGVFARDPDALLDLIELQITEDLQKQEDNKAVCRACQKYLDIQYANWREDVSQDTLYSASQMQEYCKRKLSPEQMGEIGRLVFQAKTRAKAMTAWRIEGTLREFPRFEPVNLWFDYPVHRVDKIGILADSNPDGSGTSWKDTTKRKTPEEKRNEKKDSLRKAFEANDLNQEGAVKLSDISEYMGVSINTAKKYVDESEEFHREKNGMVVRVPNGEVGL